jgi:hypothetical protein
MKIICISETHNKHRDLDIPEGDVIVHTGDFTEEPKKNGLLTLMKVLEVQLPQLQLLMNLKIWSRLA